LEGELNNKQRENFIEDFIRQKGREACIKEDILQFKEISSYIKKNVRKFKRKIYGYELWKSIQKYGNTVRKRSIFQESN
jgi:hypothetical protein